MKNKQSKKKSRDKNSTGRHSMLNYNDAHHGSSKEKKSKGDDKKKKKKKS